MIYNKAASFPYPVLAHNNDSYNDNEFYFDTELIETTKSYTFKFQYDIGSNFVSSLYDNRQIEMLFIIETEDNFFEILDYGQKEVKVEKNRLSLSKNTSIQLQLQAREDISFQNCDELSDFYEQFKDQIIIPKNSLIGYSDTVIFQGSESKPLDLLEISINPNMETAFEVYIGQETIVLNFKDSKYRLNGLTRFNSIQNMYVYVGLFKALTLFILNNLEENDSNDEAEVFLDAINQEQSTVLNQKLFDLMRNKDIDSIGFENIDNIINKMTDNIIEKFAEDIIGAIKYED